MIQVFATPDALADAVARHIVASAAEAISSAGRFTVALSGGSTPRAAYSRLAYGDLSHQLDWQRTHVLWGDERCVPPDDPRSNYRTAKEALLDRVPIPANQIHRIRGEDDPQKAAGEYERELRALLVCESRSSSLDLVLLGLGEDGHTASLFPGQPAARETTRWVAAVSPGGSRSPLTAHRSPDVWRVTLTPAALDLAKNVTFVVSGAGKAHTVQQVLEGPFAPDLLPAQAIHPAEGRLTWMVDQAAAGQLRASRAST